MFNGSCGLQDQSCNLLYKVHKTLPDLASASCLSNPPLPHRFLLQQHQIPCNLCSRPDPFSPLCLCPHFPLTGIFSPSFTWLTQFKHTLSQEASLAPPCPAECSSSRLPEHPLPGIQSLHTPLRNKRPAYVTKSPLYCGLRDSVSFIFMLLAPSALPSTEQAFNIRSLKKRERRTQGSEGINSSLPGSASAHGG